LTGKLNERAQKAYERAQARIKWHFSCLTIQYSKGMSMFSQHTTIQEFLKSLAEMQGDDEALIGRRGSVWHSTSFSELQEKAEAAAFALSAKGIRKGDKVILTAHSQPEYAVGFFALALCGAVTVPLDVKLSVNDQTYMVNFSEAIAILCLDEASKKLTALLLKNVPHLMNSVFVVEELINSGRTNTTSFPRPILQPLTNTDVAVIAFTSGTVSLPKGVMLTWNHFMFQINAISRAFPNCQKSRVLSILPLNHMLEFSAGLLIPLSMGSKVYYANSMIPQQILSFIKDKQITSMITVPLFLRAMKKGIEAEINRSFLFRIWFKAAMLLATLLPIKAVRRFIFMPVHNKLGKKLDMFVVGASRLDYQVAEFFSCLGIDTFEGYGLTETSPVVATNCTGFVRHNTVGRPLENVEVKLDPLQSNILVRGPNVMLGYYKNPISTAECISEDGWFNTGDVGKFDKQGFLQIVGRSKDIIVLGNGKKVVPEEVEGFFKDVDFIQDICVVGITARKGVNKGTELVHAVVVMNPAYLKDPIRTRDEHIEFYLSELTTMAQNLSYYKRPVQFFIQEQLLPKTSTMKTKRFLVKELLLKLEETI
jgi:long-chain acyl-CoA synthetase